MERFDIEEVRKAEDLISKFNHRAEEVVNLMFGDHDKIVTHGETYISTDGKTVTHSYWDGYDAEPFDNCDVSFPFEWINMSFEELKAIKPKFWEEELARRKHEQEFREHLEDEKHEREERAEYERLKAKFEKGRD